MKEQSKTQFFKVLIQVTWFIESFDLYKDILYLFAFEHYLPVAIVLILAIVVPFALFHKNVNSSVKDDTGTLIYPSKGPAHSFMIFYGFTIDLQEELAKAYATL